MQHVDSRGLRPLKTGERARIRIICFPHAGGVARFFRHWGPLLPDDVELLAVQYPGREDRLAEPLVSNADVLAEGLAAEIGALSTAPTVLFGHSMGAVVAYEVARRYRARPGQPVLLAVSAQPAPQSQRSAGVHLRDDDGLAEELIKIGGSAEALADPDLREHILPIVRNDYRLFETYQHAHSGPWDRPIVVYSAEQDAEVTEVELAGWREVTSAECAFRIFSGDHFYLLPHASEVIADLLGLVEALS